jgi:RsiW-degrading membrane proteinase PrsW (M82 family)
MYLKNIIHALFWGIVTAGMSLIFQLTIISAITSQVQLSEFNKDFLSSFIFLIIYALTEELFKYFIIIKKIIPLSYGRFFIINAWFAGIGFSLVEIFIIYQKNIYESTNFNLLDLAVIVPFHIFTFGILGYFLSISDKKGLSLKILLFNFILHFIYNYSIIYLSHYDRHINIFIITFLIFINIYGLITINKKLASN